MDLRALAVTMLGLFGSAGCIDPGLAVCADGRACPAGLVCDEAHHGCVSPDQLAACKDAADLTTCQTGLIPDGVCFGGICLAAGCGNLEIEPGELCDDGNLVSGDGCSADCRSREVCGDGFADPVAGELCDDGNTTAHDGCTSTCAIERMTWRRQDAGSPVARTGSAIVYDPTRRVLVMFGGQDSITPATDRADTWEWNGAAWREVTPLISPPSRFDHALAYDPKRHRLVLFGGNSARFALLADTWEYDGATWQRMNPPISPSLRAGAAMTWDPALQKLVLFGGYQDTLRYDDMWTWDGTVWTRIASPVSPGGRAFGGLSYDVAGDRLLLCGGNPTAQDFSNDLWSYDGTTWTPLATTPTLVDAAFYSALVYDPIHAQPVVTFGAFDPPGGGLFVEDFFALSGTSWQRLAVGPYNGPFFISGSAYAFDIARGMLVEWAGTNYVGPTSSLWYYDYDNDWIAATSAPGVTARTTSLAYDPDRARVVMFGGTGATADTHEWDGVQWTTPTVAGPPGRVNHAMTYDGGSHRVLVFGGANATVSFDDTWAWDGATWTDVTPTTGSPSKRRAAAIAYDSARQRVVLFGGLSATDVALFDTWEWDGAAWHDVTPASSPPAMGAVVAGVLVGTPTAAYDPIRQRVVLFGGASAETWEWDGTTWTSYPGAAKPVAARRPAMVYDRARARVVLIGGSTSSSVDAEWNGTTWSPATIASIVAPPLTDVAAVYDDARGEIVRFGGASASATLDGATWLGAYRGVDEEVCDSGHDVDRDGAIGCADDDCAPVCAHCGDGTCGPTENDRLCPVDCPATPVICGDAYCASGESVTCTADCP